jgi:hypothetical protein
LDVTIVQSIDAVIHQFLVDAGDALTDSARVRPCLFEIHAALAQHLGQVECFLQRAGELDTVIVGARAREMAIGARAVEDGRVH